jgi:hypothetical protein
VQMAAKQDVYGRSEDGEVVRAKTDRPTSINFSAPNDQLLDRFCGRCETAPPSIEEAASLIR